MTSTSRRLRRLLPALAAAAILAGACNNGGGGGNATPSAAAPTTAASTGASGGATGAVVLNVAQDATLGAIVTDGAGKTLYLFTPDTATSTACTDACAATWPPLTVASGQQATAGSGVTGQITTFARPDGSTQVVLNGHPLYYYAGDAAAGDTKGQGLNQKWYVVSPAGEQIASGRGNY